MLQIKSTLRIFSRWACKQVVSPTEIRTVVFKDLQAAKLLNHCQQNTLNVVYSSQYRCRYCGPLSPPSSSAISGLDWLLCRGRREAEWCECPRLWASARWEYIQTELQEHCSCIWAFIIESRNIYNHCIGFFQFSADNAWWCLKMLYKNQER